MIEKSLNLIGGKANSGKTKYLVEMANSLYNKKILFISLDYSNELLEEKYGLQKSNNLIVLDKPIFIEDIPNYIMDYQPDYLFVDYLMLLQIDKEKENKYRLDMLSMYSKKYNITILVSDYISCKDSKEKYKNSIYDNCSQISILEDRKIIQVK